MRENTETKTKEDIGMNLTKCNQERLSGLLILGEIDAGTYYHSKKHYQLEIKV